MGRSRSVRWEKKTFADKYGGSISTKKWGMVQKGDRGILLDGQEPGIWLMLKMRLSPF
jgi:hypothetical protein